MVTTSDEVLSSLILEMVSRISCSIIFLGAHLKLVGLLLQWCSFFTFWKIGVTFSLFQSWGTFPIAMAFQRLSKVGFQRHQSALSLVEYVRPTCLCAPKTGPSPPRESFFLQTIPLVQPIPLAAKSWGFWRLGLFYCTRPNKVLQIYS